MWYFLGLFLILSFLQFLYFNISKNPEKDLKKKIPVPIGKNGVQIVITVFIVILYLVLFWILIDHHQPHPLALTTYQYTGNYEPVPSGTVEKLYSRKTGYLHNLYFLYLYPDKSEETLEDIAVRLRRQYCEISCIINIYDDRSAYLSDMERLDITSLDVMREWNKNNYIFVADHYLGYLPAGQDARFNFHPFRDRYYEKLKRGEE